MASKANAQAADFAKILPSFFAEAPPPNRPCLPQRRRSRLAHVHYLHPDLNKINKFLLDFGFEVVEETPTKKYYRGFGSEPYLYIAEASPDAKRHFAGGAWVVSSLQDLERASQFPGATPIKDASGPGGGKTVVLKDPWNFEIFLHFGQKESSDEQKPETVIINTAQMKPRKGEFQRFKKGPSKLHKLGHYGLVVPAADFFKAREWYSTTFNLAVTDSIFNPETGEDETSFLHIDKGEEFSDHHSFFVASDPKASSPHVHHSSFEVHDMDTQLLGHDWLEEQGWKNCWGVGRHFLGSQIFDYWFDASGNVIEHYSDGDLVNCKTEVTRSPASPESLYIWGPNVPLAFITGKVEDVQNKGGVKETFQAPVVAA